MISGSRRNTPRKMKAAAIRNQRASGFSLVGEVTTAFMAKGGMIAMSAIALAAPRLEKVDDQQHDEGDHQHDRGDRSGRGIIVFLELDDDQQRRDLGLERPIACDEDDRAV